MPSWDSAVSHRLRCCPRSNMLENAQLAIKRFTLQLSGRGSTWQASDVAIRALWTCWASPSRPRPSRHGFSYPPDYQTGQKPAPLHIAIPGIVPHKNSATDDIKGCRKSGGDPLGWRL